MNENANILAVELLPVWLLGMRLRVGGREGAKGVMLVAFLRLCNILFDDLCLTGFLTVLRKGRCKIYISNNSMIYILFVNCN